MISVLGNRFLRRSRSASLRSLSMERYFIFSELILESEFTALIKIFPSMLRLVRLLSRAMLAGRSNMTLLLISSVSICATLPIFWGISLIWFTGSPRYFRFLQTEILSIDRCRSILSQLVITSVFRLLSEDISGGTSTSSHSSMVRDCSCFAVSIAAE